MNARAPQPHHLLHYVTDADGNAVQEPDMDKWAAWLATVHRQVGVYADGVTLVSTVFVGIDVFFGLYEGPALLWETMVFGGPLDGTVERYASLSAAVAGHAEMVRRAQHGEQV